MKAQKTAVVTGASGGIGRQIAFTLSQNGFRVAAVYHDNRKSAENLLEQIRSANGSAQIYRCDLANSREVSRLQEKVIEDFSGVDVLINNAGIASQKLITDVSDDEFDRMMDVNFKSVFLMTKAFLPHFIHKKQGKIINISSIWGLTGASCEVVYSASKAAVIGFSKALAKEVGPSGIQVNCVAPGVIETPMLDHLSDTDKQELAEETPLQRLGSPIDVANTVLFLAGNAGEFFTGQILSPNGGIVI